MNQSSQTKIKLLKAYSSLFTSLQPNHDLFAITAVFNSGWYQPSPERWLDEYRHKVLWKIKKRLTHSGLNCIPFEDFAAYEFEESSIFRSARDKRKPHHIHGLIPIPKALSHKVWNQERNEVDPRLFKDFNSIHTISGQVRNLL